MHAVFKRQNLHALQLGPRSGTRGLGGGAVAAGAVGAAVGAMTAMGPSFKDERQALAEHKAAQRARLEAIEREERAAYEDAANELNELRISKARDERAAAVLAAQER